MDRPGCSVESTIFLAFHISGVITFASPVLYDVTRRFACSRPEEETKSVLRGKCQSMRSIQNLLCPGCGSLLLTFSTCSRREWSPAKSTSVISLLVSSSPRICYLCRLLDTTPVGREVILRRRQISIARQGRGHCWPKRPEG